MDHPLASWDSGKVDVGVVDAVEDIGEDCGRESQADLDELSVAVAGGFDRCELLGADGAAGFRELADEAGQRIALTIARGLAVANVLQFVRLQSSVLAEQAVRSHAVIAARDTAYDQLDGFLVALAERARREHGISGEDGL